MADSNKNTNELTQDELERLRALKTAESIPAAYMDLVSTCQQEVIQSENLKRNFDKIKSVTPSPEDIYQSGPSYSNVLKETPKKRKNRGNNNGKNDEEENKIDYSEHPGQGHQDDNSGAIGSPPPSTPQETLQEEPPSDWNLNAPAFEPGNRPIHSFSEQGENWRDGDGYETLLELFDLSHEDEDDTIYKVIGTYFSDFQQELEYLRSLPGSIGRVFLLDYLKNNSATNEQENRRGFKHFLAGLRTGLTYTIIEQASTVEARYQQEMKLVRETVESLKGMVLSLVDSCKVQKENHDKLCHDLQESISDIRAIQQDLTRPKAPLPMIPTKGLNLVKRKIPEKPTPCKSRSPSPNRGQSPVPQKSAPPSKESLAEEFNKTAFNGYYEQYEFNDRYKGTIEDHWHVTEIIVFGIPIAILLDFSSSQYQVKMPKHKTPKLTKRMKYFIGCLPHFPIQHLKDPCQLNLWIGKFDGMLENDDLLDAARKLATQGRDACNSMND